MLYQLSYSVKNIVQFFFILNPDPPDKIGILYSTGWIINCAAEKGLQIYKLHSFFIFCMKKFDEGGMAPF